MWDCAACYCTWQQPEGAEVMKQEGRRVGSSEQQTKKADSILLRAFGFISMIFSHYYNGTARMAMSVCLSVHR